MHQNKTQTSSAQYGALRYHGWTLLLLRHATCAIQRSTFQSPFLRMTAIPLPKASFCIVQSDRYTAAVTPRRLRPTVLERPCGKHWSYFGITGREGAERNSVPQLGLETEQTASSPLPRCRWSAPKSSPSSTPIVDKWCAASTPRLMRRRRR